MDQYNDLLMKFSSQDNFITDINFLYDTTIYEYDIRQANINCLYANDLINIEEYFLLSGAPKEYREIKVGLMIKNNPDFGRVIKDTIRLAKYKLMVTNGISPNEVVRIANDSMYIQRPLELQQTVIGIGEGMFEDRNCEFVLKNKFQNFIRLSKTLLIFFGTENDSWNIDVKGINDRLLPLHEKFISTICSFVDMRQYAGKEMTMREFNKFFNDYINYQLPVEYYREFNSDSLFKVKEYSLAGESIGIINIPGYIDKRLIDINCNLNILRILYSYLIQS